MFTGSKQTAPQGEVGRVGSDVVPESLELAPGQALADEAAVLAAPQVVANSLPEYIGAWWHRVRSGDSGVLPVVVALVVVVITFQLINSLFLSANNLVNLFDQSVVFVVFAMAEVVVLLLGEIDLSLVYNAGISAGVIGAAVAPPYNLPWWVAIILGLACGAIIGVINGALVVFLRLPAFIVTLAGWIGWQGVMVWQFDVLKVAQGGGSISVTNKVLLDLVSPAGSLSETWSWVVMIVLVALFAAYLVITNIRRRASGLVTPPMGLTLLKAGAVAVAGIVVVIVCNINRATVAGTAKQAGVPYSIPIVLAMFLIATFMLTRTRFGRYIYAIGGNTEAARRAGINVNRVRIASFGVTGLLAGTAGLLYLSEYGGIQTGIDPNFVLYAVGAAVIGGTSLFGGRGKPIHALLGGLVIAAVYNGIYLIGLTAAAQDMLVAIVLIIAVTVDSMARRGTTRLH